MSVEAGPAGIEIELNAAIVSVHEETPIVAIVETPVRSADRGADLLPFGPFDPLRHRTMETGLRSWVLEQRGIELGYVEQLYSFGDRGRHAEPGDIGPHVVSIGYLALTQLPAGKKPKAGWRAIYDYFPWEDWREGRPEILDSEILPRLRRWAGGRGGSEDRNPLSRRERLALCFGVGPAVWDDERVLERYELLYEAGLMAEALRDGRETAKAWQPAPTLGRPMRFDHRRILATAMGRLRAKIKYRPVIFELMPAAFTLTELQRTVESIAGRHLHKQNFRRLVEQGQLVEPTGTTRLTTGGRPAQLFRFRREVLPERPAPGLRYAGR
ncbi:MAG: hypothetical protein AB7O39_15295 [Flavobacteriaceae bacterium]